VADELDVVVLGGGTGGYSTALHAAHLGLKVALVERDLLGGTCLNRGCIPTKALLHSAEVYDTVRDASKFGVDAGDPAYDWRGVQGHKDRVVKKLVSGVELLLRNRKVEVMKGSGTIAGPGRVKVGDRELTSKNVVVATGSRPKTIPGIEIGGRVLTSDEALLTEVPKSAIVLGGGAIGCEFASIWASFGSKVTIVEMLETLVPIEDADLGKTLAKAFSKRGIKVFTGAKLEDTKAGEDSVIATVTQNGKTETIEAEVLLVAVGRRPVTEGAGLASVGIETDRGFVPVGDRCQTSADGTYAVGDVISVRGRVHPMLAHASFAEGILIAEEIAGKRPPSVEYDAVPRATYCTPEVAAVGLTEAEARERGYEVRTDTVNFVGIGKASILGDTTGFCKIVAEQGGPILGVHLIGPRVTELIAEGMLAVGWEALPEEVAQFVHPHPTLSEAFGEAALALSGKALHTV
jgi:dihydrolipoamide dehydrogenase